jgi:hypothetical protein
MCEKTDLAQKGLELTKITEVCTKKKAMNLFYLK